MKLGKLLLTGILITTTTGCTYVKSVSSKLEDKTVETLIQKFDVLESKIMTDDYLFEAPGMERVRQDSYTRDLMKYFSDDYPSTISYSERKDLIKKVDAVFENAQNVMATENQKEKSRAKHMFYISLQDIYTK
ncbi:MAG: hypothetical protein ABIB43_05210 [archaeon]